MGENVSAVLKHRRGNTSEITSMIPEDCEIVIDTDKYTAVIGDGITQGGVELAKAATVDNHISSIDNPHEVTASQVGAYTKTEVDDLIANVDLTNYYTKSEIDTQISPIEDDIELQKELILISKDFLGVVDRGKSSLTCVNSIVKLTFNSDSLLYRNGQKLSFTAGTEFTLDVSGVREGSYIALNDSNNGLKLVGAIPNFFEDLLIAYVYRNETEVMIFSDERHSASIDTDWRTAQHLNVGAVLRSGGNLSISLEDTENLSLNISTPMVVADEDLVHTITNGSGTNPYEQILSPVANIPYVYIGSNHYYEQSVKSTFPYPVGVSHAKYNDISTGTLVEASDGDYICYFLVYMNDMHQPIKLVVGRQRHTTLDSALTENFDSLGLSMPEIVPLNKIIAQTKHTFTNKLKFVSNVKIVDRLSSVNTSFVPTNHGSLFGRDALDQHTIGSITGLEDTISGIETEIANISSSINTKVSVPTAYMIYGGDVEVTNSILTTGFGVYVYTGNTTSRPVINLGMDIESQWGNDSSESFSYLIEIKCRSIDPSNWVYVDGIRGSTKYISSNTTSSEITDLNLFTLSTSGGETSINIGTSSAVNTNGATYVMSVYQTTHKKTGVTNQGKAFTEYYNPYSGITIEKYEGSGTNPGHEISHSLGRKLSIAHIKNITSSTDWLSLLLNFNVGDYVNLNLNNQMNNTTNAWSSNTDNSVTIGGAVNALNNSYIMYGYRNSFIDSDANLIGNYEIGERFGDGIVGSKLKTKKKPLLIMFKRLDSTGGWDIFDIKRDYYALYANSSTSESIGQEGNFVDDGFIFTNPTNNFELNTNGARYEYFVVYDNDGGSGKSKYPRATDNSRLQINSSYVPYSNGVSTTGQNTTVSFKNETITVSNGLSLGRNYVASLNDGTYVSRQKEPSYGIKNPLNTGSEFFNLNTLKWYSDSNVEITPRTYLPYVVYADQNGQVTFVEEFSKVTHFEKIETIENRKVIYLADYGVNAIQANKRYIIKNPFGNENAIDCDTRIELYLNGKWGEAGWDGNTGTGSTVYGVKSGCTEEGIVVQTAITYLEYNSNCTGSMLGTPNTPIASAPARVIVQYNGKTKRV